MSSQHKKEIGEVMEMHPSSPNTPDSRKSHNTSSDPSTLQPRALKELLLTTTPALLSIFDEQMPEHKFTNYFPVSLLEDASLGLTNLDDLLRGTKIYMAPKPAKVIDEKYAESRRLLRERLEEESYQRMVEGPSVSSLADNRNDLRELRNQLSTIVNVIISIFTAAMASWYWTSRWSTGGRVLTSLGSAIALGAIETFLYYRYRVKIEQGRAHEARIVSHLSSKLGQSESETKKTK